MKKLTKELIKHVCYEAGIGVFIWRFIVYANWYFQDLADRQDQ